MLREIIEALNAGYIMEAEAARQMAEIAYLIRAGKIELTKEAFDIKAFEPSVIERKTESGAIGRLSFMRVEGAMFRSTMPCGPMGYLEMAEKLQAFDQDPDIDAHLFRMHSPGGQIDGLETFANTIAETEKPTIFFGEVMASAAVYAAVGGSSIVLSGRNARIGSIGVQSHYRSVRKMLAERGIEEFTIKSPTSPDKNSYDLEKPEGRDQFAKEILGPLDAHFMDHVKTHRPGIDESALTGKIYFAEEAIKLGLADHIGTFESAVTLALDMAGKNKSSNKFYMSKPAEEAALEQGNVNPTAQEQGGGNDNDKTSMEQMNEAVEARISAMSQIIEGKDQVIAFQTATIEDLKKVVASQKQEIERLAQLPADDPEAEVTASEEDASNKMEDKENKGEPVPAAILEAIGAGRKRRARHIKKGIIKTE